MPVGRRLTGQCEADRLVPLPLRRRVDARLVAQHSAIGNALPLHCSTDGLQSEMEFAVATSLRSASLRRDGRIQPDGTLPRAASRTLIAKAGLPVASTRRSKH
jgi:hypothetical protein